MNRHLVDALTQLYPASWRRRYAAEFSAFLEESNCGIRDVADILWSALREHLLSKGEREMNRSQHASGFLAFSFLAALAAGMNLVMTVDDSPLIVAMRSHMGMSVAWNLLAGASVLSGIGVLSIVFLFTGPCSFTLGRRAAETFLLFLAFPSLEPELSCFGARVVWLIPAEDGLQVHGPFSAAAAPLLSGRRSMRVGSAASSLSFSLLLSRLQVRSASTWRFGVLILEQHCGSDAPSQSWPIHLS